MDGMRRWRGDEVMSGGAIERERMGEWVCEVGEGKGMEEGKGKAGGR